MTQIATQSGEEDPVAFTRRWLATWEEEQTVNGFVVPAQDMLGVITNPWLFRSGGSQLDLRVAPFRLLAIVSRLDLRKIDEHGTPLDAGEARFVFGATDQQCERIPLLVIFEFKQQAETIEQVRAWAARWHSLGTLDFGEDFNQALQELTQSFTSTLNQVRTNDNAVSFIDWEQRTYVLCGRDLALAPLDQTPDASFNDSQALADYINANQENILGDRHVVPLAFRGGDIPTFLGWGGTGLEDRFEVRHHFALATCNGCHTYETSTPFTHLANRRQHEFTRISDYLTGNNMPVFDLMGRPRYFNELERRARDLQNVVDGNNLSALSRPNRVH